MAEKILVNSFRVVILRERSSVLSHMWAIEVLACGKSPSAAFKRKNVTGYCEALPILIQQRPGAQ